MRMSFTFPLTFARAPPHAAPPSRPPVVSPSGVLRVVLFKQRLCIGPAPQLPSCSHSFACLRAQCPSVLHNHPSRTPRGRVTSRPLTSLALPTPPPSPPPSSTRFSCWWIISIMGFFVAFRRAFANRLSVSSVLVQFLMCWLLCVLHNQYQINPAELRAAVLVCWGPSPPAGLLVRALRQSSGWSSSWHVLSRRPVPPHVPTCYAATLWQFVSRPVRALWPNRRGRVAAAWTLCLPHRVLVSAWSLSGSSFSRPRGLRQFVDCFACSAC